MSPKYQAYPEYKDSGVEWLDKVPVHWLSVPIKYTALEKGSLFLDGDWIESKDIAGDEIRYITTGNVGEGNYKEQGLGFITKEKFKQLGCTEVFEGDILISRLNVPIGRSCIVPDLHSRIVTSVDNVIFRPDRKFFKQYLVHLFSSKDYFKHTSNLARGATMQRISRGLLGNIRIVVPSYEEQQRIANFLGHETAKIDTLIEKQQQLIKLLKEKRQAVISHAVTKGLNPNAPMRDSGIEWLGEVPEHWELKKVSWLFRAEKGKNGQLLTKEYCGLNPGKFPVYSGQTENEGVMGRIDSFEFDTGEGGVLFSTTVGAKAMHLSHLKGKFSLSQNCMIIIPTNRQTDTRYCYYHLQPLFIYERGLIPEHMQASFRMDDLYQYVVAIPPVSEQKEIAAFLDHEVLSIEKVIDKATIAIQLMQERRTALISAAVTGKIDVRNLNAPNN